MIPLLLACSEPMADASWSSVSVGSLATCAEGPDGWSCWTSEPLVLPEGGTDLWIDTQGSDHKVSIACAVEAGALQCVADPGPYPFQLPEIEVAAYALYHHGGVAIDHAGRAAFWDNGEYPGEVGPRLDGEGWSEPRGQGEKMCLVDSSGVPLCWGGPVVVPVPSEAVRVAAPGYWDVCFLLHSGEVVCEYENPDWIGTPLPAESFLELENTSHGFLCGVREDTTLACSGWHDDSEAEEDRPIEPRDYPDGDGWHDLTCRMSHCCAFQGDELECWGAVDDGDYLDVPPRPPESGP